MIIILTKKLYLSYCSVNLRVFFFNVILTILVGYIYKSHKLRIMKLNTKSRYAVMALADMARFDGKNPVSLRDISLRQSISLLYLEQIFLRLKKNNIVKSVRGTNGGYIISKNINDLKISDIFYALDEKVKTVGCKKESKKGCNGKSSKCITHNLWDELDLHINSFFENKKLGDLVKKKKVEINERKRTRKIKRL